MGLFSKRGKEIIGIVASGNIDMLLQALQNGVSLDYSDFRGWTPLKVAVSMGNAEIVQILLSHGASTSLSCPLLLACLNENIEIVKLFLQYNANPNISDGKGWTPLMISAQQGNLEIVKLLLEHGANKEAETSDGWTALNAAIQNNNLDVVGLLANNISSKKEISKIKKKFNASKEKILRKKEKVYIIGNMKKFSKGFVKFFLMSKREQTEWENEQLRKIYKKLAPKFRKTCKKLTTKKIIIGIVSLWVSLMVVLIIIKQLCG